MCNFQTIEYLFYPALPLEPVHMNDYRAIRTS